MSPPGGRTAGVVSRRHGRSGIPGDGPARAGEDREAGPGTKRVGRPWRTLARNGLRAVPRSRRRRLALGAVVLFLLTVGWHAGHLDEVGITWDEPVYVQAANGIQGWVAGVVRGPDRSRLLTPEAIDRVWDWKHYWNPHPPVFREGMAVTEAVAGGLMGEVQGARLFPLTLFGLTVALVFWAISVARGSLEGLAAALALLLMPRLVGHAHIAATDLPLTFFWLVASLSFLRYVQGGDLRWAAVAAAGFGLGMGTKFTGYLLPIPLLGWWLTSRYRFQRRWGVLLFLLAGAAVAWIVNPLAWHEPLGYTARLIGDSLSRAEVVPVKTYYLGQSYRYVVPWHHPLVMTLVTVPLPIMALALWAGCDLEGDGWRDLETFSLVQVGFFLLLLALPSSPNHDGVRLFLPMFPFVGLLAASGFGAAASRLRGLAPQSRWIATLAMLSVFFYPAYLQTTGATPYYLSYYNGLIGGPRGAEMRGMEPTYWFDALTPGFFERVNDVLPRKARLASLPVTVPVERAKRLGLLREDIRIAGDTVPAPYVLLYGRKGVFSRVEHRLYDRVRPVLAARYEGALLVGLYAWSMEDLRRLQVSHDQH